MQVSLYASISPSVDVVVLISRWSVSWSAGEWMRELGRMDEGARERLIYIDGGGE